MAVVLPVKELHQKRRSSIKDGKITHTRAFLVVTDDIADGTAVALVAPGIPAYGDPHPADPGCTVNSIEADPVNDSSNHFEVTVEYGTADGGFVIVDNPLNRPPEVSWNSSETTTAYFIDNSNPPKLVVNSAGEPFDSFLEREAGELGITISMNEATYDANAADAYSHTVNDGPVIIDTTTFAPGTLKLSPITATKVSEFVETDGVKQKFTYYKKTYNLKARREGWKDKPLDAGLNEKVGDLATGFKLKPILDVTHQPVKKALALDGSGKVKNTDPTVPPVTLEFQPYKQIAWPFPWNNAQAWAASAKSAGATHYHPTENTIMAVALSTEAFRRIAAATKKVERTLTNMTGDRTPSYGSAPGFWAMILGTDISGLRYTFNKVAFDPTSTEPEAFTINDTVRFAFDGEPNYQAGFEVSGNRGIGLGTIVWVAFAGYDVTGNPTFLFSHPTFDTFQPITPHDHRDNNNGGFAFSTFHPGTSTPQMPWAM